MARQCWHKTVRRAVAMCADRRALANFFLGHHSCQSSE